MHLSPTSRPFSSLFRLKALFIANIHRQLKFRYINSQPNRQSMNLNNFYKMPLIQFKFCHKLIKREMCRFSIVLFRAIALHPDLKPYQRHLDIAVYVSMLVSTACYRHDLMMRRASTNGRLSESAIQDDNIYRFSNRLYIFRRRV